MLMQPETDEAGKPAEPIWAVVVPRTLATCAVPPNAALESAADGGAAPGATASDALKARVDLAVMWAKIALQQPTLEPDARPPLGYSIRPDGAYQDALLTERALEALGALIDEGADELPSLYALRAELEKGWGQFDLAADDLRAAIAMLDLHVGEPGIDAWAHQLRAQLDDTLAAGLPRLGRKGRKQLDEAVERMSRSFAGAFSATPPELLLFEHDALPVPLHPKVREAGEQISAIGLKHLAWVEDLAHGRSTGRRSMVGAWHDAGGTTVFVAMAAPGSWRNSATTLLSDGRIISTSDGPSRFGFQGGPKIDRLIANLDGSCQALLDLHRARLRAVLAASPGVSTVPILTRDGFLELEHREWSLQKALRLEQGLSEGEARAVPFDRPEFAELLRTAVRDKVRAVAG